MPKFTITTDNSKSSEHKEEPLEFPNAKAATDDAQIALADMAREALPDGEQADFAVNVKDETGNEIYQASLAFSANDEDRIAREDEESDAAMDELAALIRGIHRPL